MGYRNCDCLCWGRRQRNGRPSPRFRALLTFAISLACGVAVWGDRPILVLLFGSTGVTIWFAEPLARNLRDHYAERLKRRLERDDNFQGARVTKSPGGSRAEDYDADSTPESEPPSEDGH